METIRASSTPAEAITANDVVLVAVAHPDDEAVLHGELIRHAVEAGAETHLAFATVGEASTINSRFWNPGFVAAHRRWREVLRAAKVLGVPQQQVHNLGLPDGALGRHAEELTEKLGELLVAKNITKLVTSGPVGYDKHADHIAVDTAARQLMQESQGKEIQHWQLVHDGSGDVRLPVDSRRKLRATIAHFSQFMGLHIFGHVFLPAKTKRYLANYRDLVYGLETYNVSSPGDLNDPDSYRSHV